MDKVLQYLMERLGYTFQDIKLLSEALTHRSLKGANNERLEFLGDAALNFIIAEALYQKHPNANEGELSRLRASLVKGETLAILGQEFKIASYLYLGTGELKSGGAQRESIQADAIEAIIGAVFLDGGFEACRTTVLAWFKDRIDNPELTHGSKDPKTLLQEHLQANKYPLPIYTIQKITGQAHNQTFNIECRVEGILKVTSGTGKSRRKAEQNAAGNFLELLGQKNDE